MDKTGEEAYILRNQIAQLDQQRKSMPSGDVHDPNYKRVYYSRYADDTLMGIIGTKEDAQETMGRVKEFLKNTLNLPISEEKSEIRHAAQGMIFLGYEVRTYSNNKVLKVRMGKRHTKKRTINHKIDLYVPEEKVKKFCQAKGYGNYDDIESKHRPELLNLSDYEIIGAYNAELRGLANYYALAHDAKRKLNRLAYIFQASLLKTLASKHKTGVKEMILELREGKDYVLQYKVNGEEKKVRIFKLKDLTPEPKTWERVDLLPNTCS